MKRKIVKGLLAVILLTALLGGIEALLFQDIPLLGFCIAAVALFYAALWLSHRLVPREPRTWRRWFVKELVSVGLVCTAWSALFASLYLFPSFFISTKTTYITEPRLKEFYGVNYLVHFERNVPHEDNAARQIIAAMGYPRLMFLGIKDKPKNILYAKLDLPNDLKPTVHFTSYNSFLYETLSEEERKHLDDIRARHVDGVPLPYSDEEREILQPWFESNESAFTFLEEALQKPAFYIPPMYGRHCANDDDEYCPAVDRDVCEPIVDSHDLIFDIAKVYCMCCRYHLSLGNTEKAWHDVRQLYRLVELNHPGISMESSLVIQQTLQFYANRVAESVLLQGNWSGEDIRQARQVIVDSHRPLTDADVQRIMEGERLYRLTSLQHIPRAFTFLFSLPSSILPIGQAMIATNRAFDELRENYNEKFESRGFDNSKGITDVFRLSGWYGLRGGVRNGLGESAGSTNVDFLFRKVVNRANRLQTEMELTQLVFALELYQKEHENRYPPNLETLCNGYIEKVPVDPFSKVGESMIYKVNDDRIGYLVYSVGRNGIDDGGLHDNTCSNYIKSGAHFEDNLTYTRYECYSYICVCERTEKDDIWRKLNYETD